LDKNKFVEVGDLKQEFIDLMNINVEEQKVYRSKGLIVHLMKQKHYNCIKHIDKISDIVSEPDYIGINPNENGITVELIKIIDKNILVGIKLNTDENYLYVSTMHDVQESKIQRRLHSGRIKKIDNINNK